MNQKNNKSREDLVEYIKSWRDSMHYEGGTKYFFISLKEKGEDSTVTFEDFTMKVKEVSLEFFHRGRVYKYELDSNKFDLQEEDQIQSEQDKNRKKELTFYFKDVDECFFSDRSRGTMELINLNEPLTVFNIYIKTDKDSFLLTKCANKKGVKLINRLTYNEANTNKKLHLLIKKGWGVICEELLAQDSNEQINQKEGVTIHER